MRFVLFFLPTLVTDLLLIFLAFLIVLNTMRSKTSRYSADEKLMAQFQSDIDSLS